MSRRLGMLLVAVAAMLTIAMPAPAYVPNTLDFVGGVPVVAHWPTSAFPVPMQVTRGITTDITDGSDRAALESAMATWSNVSESRASLLLERESDVQANVFDGINAIEFSNSSALDAASFVTLTYLLTDVDGTILEADTLVNDRVVGFTTTAGSNVGLDLETVMLRALGRALGLGSSPYGARATDGTVEVAAPVMYVVSRDIGETKRDLSSDDIAAIDDLYPAPGSQRGAITGTVTRGGSALFGAHVLVYDPVHDVTVGAVSLPDGSFRVGGLPAGRYVVEILPLRTPATPAAIGGIFDSDLVDNTFQRVFHDRVINVSPGAVTAGVMLEVQQ